MTRHKEKPIDYEKVLAAMQAQQREWDADPERPKRVGAWQQEKADFMATLDCECKWNCCEGNDTLRYCHSDTL